jgi:hypothetical protein
MADNCGYTIAQVQQGLKINGRYNGPTDGVANADYANALISYLQANGISPDELVVAPGSAPPPKVCAAIDRLFPRDTQAVSTSTGPETKEATMGSTGLTMLQMIGLVAIGGAGAGALLYRGVSKSPSSGWTFGAAVAGGALCGGGYTLLVLSQMSGPG